MTWHDMRLDTSLISHTRHKCHVLSCLVFKVSRQDKTRHDITLVSLSCLKRHVHKSEVMCTWLKTCASCPETCAHVSWDKTRQSCLKSHVHLSHVHMSCLVWSWPMCTSQDKKMSCLTLQRGCNKTCTHGSRHVHLWPMGWYSPFFFVGLRNSLAKGPCEYRALCQRDLTMQGACKLVAPPPPYFYITNIAPSTFLYYLVLILHKSVCST